MNLKVRKQAQTLLNELTGTARDQLERVWQRRDVSDEDALDIRRELLALQRVELNLTKLIEASEDE